MSMPSRVLMAVFLTFACLGCGTLQADDSPRPTDPRVARAIKESKRGDQPTRLAALHRLGRLGHRSESAVVELTSGLADPAPEIRAATAEVLGRIGSSAEPANPVLIAALRDPERAVRSAAAAALIRTRPDARQAIPALAASLRADPEGFAAPAVDSLAAMGEPAVPVAIELLREASSLLPPIGAQVLARLGPAARGAVSELIAALHRPERETREQAAAALASIGEPALDALTQAIRDHDPRVRGGAARALELMGNGARPA